MEIIGLQLPFFIPTESMSVKELNEHYTTPLLDHVNITSNAATIWLLEKSSGETGYVPI